MEDLERRAGSSSASPEQKHEELAQPEKNPSDQASRIGTQRQRSNSAQISRARTPEVLTQQYALPSDDRSMFSQQFTRQLSTSPPPFSYDSLPSTESISYASYAPTASYYGLPSTTMEMPLYSQYQPAVQHQYVPSMSTPPIKQEIYGDDESVECG